MAKILPVKWKKLVIKFCSSWQTGSISDKTSLMVCENRVRTASDISAPTNEPEAIDDIELALETFN
jgi:hypothetical protein